MFGFLFNNNKHNISTSKYMDDEDAYNLGDGYSNIEDMYVYCVECGQYMRYEEGDKNNCYGTYICPSCKKKTREQTLFNKLEKEEMRMTNFGGIEMPEGCAACGGPYPNCTTSCKLFDD